MKKTHIQQLMEKEYHEFTSKPVAFIEGFISRRKAANDKLRAAVQRSTAEARVLAETAAFYNRVFNAAVDAFKGNPDQFLSLLEAGGNQQHG